MSKTKREQIAELRGEVKVGRELEKVRDEKTEGEIDRRVHSIEREFGAFMISIKEEFKKVNELRGALSDLSRDMWTRREGEAAVKTSQLALETALTTATAVTDKLEGQITLLRSPNDERTGAEKRSQQISTKTLAWVAIAATTLASVFAVAATEIIKLIGG
jgi:hypothetical protein